MKSQFIFGLIFLSTVFSASLIAQDYLEDCRVFKVVDGNEFEESLSADEYPDIEVNRGRNGLTVYVGSNLPWEESEGDIIRRHYYSSDESYFSFRRKGDSRTYFLRTEATSSGKRVGKLYRKSRKNKLIAIASCKDVEG